MQLFKIERTYECTKIKIWNKIDGDVESCIYYYITIYTIFGIKFINIKVAAPYISRPYYDGEYATNNKIKNQIKVDKLFFKIKYYDN